MRDALAAVGLPASEQVTLGIFRVDFLVAGLLVVECDGHQWHNTTREQAQRDRERDRLLLISGYPVIRFTGSEIVYSPVSCAVQVQAALAALRGQRVSGFLHEAAEMIDAQAA